MKDLKGAVAIITGASRGLGVEVARALAGRGMRLVLAARSAEGLAAVSAGLEAGGAEVLVVPTDLTEPAALDHLVAETLRAFGAVDLLVNNAGIVEPKAYGRFTLDEIEQHIALNLAAPMTLTHRVLPHMLDRDRGHIVNVASLAGLLGVGWGETYSATKHGVVGFTRALRSFLRVSGSRVSVSVVCPGFIGELGMYADRAHSQGHTSPWTLGVSPPEAVVAGVMRAIDRDRAEVIVSPRPVRLLLAIGALSPRLGGWLGRRLGLHAVFESIAKAG